jgi:flagellin
MSFSIQTNVNSLVAQQNLSVNSAFQSRTIQRLTSGYRINSSGDDAAGLAVANKFRNATAELTQGVANGNDAVASLQIMDGGINNIGKMLDRLKTLAMQSASASFTGNRATLNSEFQTDIAEIDRQAQSIGLNTGGTFAKDLSIYLGAGTGSQTASNSVVNINLSSATVDSQSLGLKGVQAVNGKAYDLGGASATSVSAIINDDVNAGNTSNPATSTQFTFYGAGFSNADGTTANGGVTIDVNLNGVGDTNSLVNAINTAIDASAAQATSQASGFKAAGIQASIVTDSSGNQKLAFSSSNSAFEVSGADQVANALMGNFAGAGIGTTAATGAVMGTQLDARTAVQAAGAGLQKDYSTNSITFTITGAGNSSPKTVTFNKSEVGNTNDAAGQAAIAADINAAFAGTGVTVANNAGSLRFTATGAFSISAVGNGDGSAIAALGLNASGSTAGITASGSKYSSYVSGGAYEMASSASGSATASNFQWNGGVGPGQTQTISVAANDASGVSHTLSVNLDNTETTLDAAIGAINDTLQKSGDSTLKQITAVKVNDSGVDKINFVSTLSSFSVAVGSTMLGLEGIADAAGKQGTTTSAEQIGAGGSADISTMSGAQTAVGAITKAVASLGTAQASIGKGQNQLNYAISLAQSQISNFSSAESQIRDTDVASEAANLSKAQVLQQASIAAMAQANSAPQAVLALLRG